MSMLGEKLNTDLRRRLQDGVELGMLGDSLLSENDKPHLLAEKGLLTDRMDKITSVRGSMIEERTLLPPVMNDNDKSLFDMVRDVGEQFGLIMEDLEEVRKLQRKQIRN